MRDQTGLRRLVIIGRHNQRRIGTDIFGMAHQSDRLGGVIGSSTRNHRHAARRKFHDLCDNLFMFVMAERGAFARCTHRDEAMAA